MLQILNENSELVGQLPEELDDKTLVELYRSMIRTRIVDEKLANLNLQGRIATYYKVAGQEANVGAAMAMGEKDWMIPHYRDLGMWLIRGMPLETPIRFWFSTADVKWNTDEHRVARICSTIGTQLPHATGVAYAAKQLEPGTVVVASFAEGSTSTPDFHGALNLAGVWNVPAVFLCQNNQWTEETPVSKQTASETIAQKAQAYGFEGVRVDGQDVIAVYAAMKEAVDRARNGGGPTLVEMLTYRYSPHFVMAIDPRPQEEKDHWYALDPVGRIEKFLMGREILSTEDKDGMIEEVSEEADALIDAVEKEKKAEGLPDPSYIVRNVFEKVPPRLVEYTNTWANWSGKIEADFSAEEIWTPAQEAIPDGGEKREMCMREAINTALHEGMEARPNMIVLGEDVAFVGGEFRVTQGLLDTYGEDRVIDTPLCELGFIGAALGMTLGGLRPVAEIMFSGFIYSAFDHVFGHISRWRQRYQGKTNVPMVIRMGYGPGLCAHESHGDTPEAYFAHTPGLTVVMPSTPTDAKGMMAAALESEDPVVFFEPMVLYEAPKEEVPVDHYTVPLGRAKIRQSGSDVTLVTYGRLVGHALQAAEQSGASVGVIDLRTLQPWDEETVIASVEKTGRLMVVHDAARSVSLAAEICATVVEKAIYSLQAPPVRVTGPDAPRLVRQMEPLINIGTTQIESAIRQLIEA